MSKIFLNWVFIEELPATKEATHGTTALCARIESCTYLLLCWKRSGLVATASGYRIAVGSYSLAGSPPCQLERF